MMDWPILKGEENAIKKMGMQTGHNSKSKITFWAENG